MTLTKTEAALLAEAARSPHGRVCVEHGYQGTGKKRAFGVRRQAAACRLMDKGLLVRVHGDGGSALYSTNGYGINGWAFSSVWKLVE